MKKIVIVLFLIALSFVVMGMNVVQYIQLHQTSDGGYIDTPTTVARYGNLFETIYMQKIANEYKKEFVSPSYFENYIELLKTHSTYFKAPTWINYSVVVSKYLKSQNKSIDLEFLNTIDAFLSKHLKDFKNDPSYYQMVADGLTLSVLLGKDPTKTPIYQEALNILKKSVDGKLYANAGLTILAAFGKNNLALPKIENVKKFVSNNTSYISSNYLMEMSLLKLGVLTPEFVKKTFDVSAIEKPSQLYAYEKLSKLLGVSLKSAKSIFERLEKERAPFGGFYDVGVYSTPHDTYWATKALKLFGKEADKNYWVGFISNLVSSASSYPPNMLAKYIDYALNVNDEYHILNSSEVNTLSKAFKNKMDLSPALEAYYLATFNFENAYEVLNVIQRTNYKNDEVFSNIHTVLDRLFSGLNKIESSKRNLSYYYDYVKLLNFAHKFGYPIDKETVKKMNDKFLEYIKKSPYVDLNLLNASLNLERYYKLPIDKDFYISNISKLKDPKTGGYFYNTMDGVETFESIYLANNILYILKGTL